MAGSASKLKEKPLPAFCPGLGARWSHFIPWETEGTKNVHWLRVLMCSEFESWVFHLVGQLWLYSHIDLTLLLAVWLWANLLTYLRLHFQISEQEVHLLKVIVRIQSLEWCLAQDCAVLCLVAQLCLTLCDPMDCSPPGSSVHEDSPGKNIRVGCHAPLRGLNPGLPLCRQIIYHLSHERRPRTLEWVVYPFSRGSSRPRNQTGLSWIVAGFFTSWATREALA